MSVGSTWYDNMSSLARMHLEGSV